MRCPVHCFGGHILNGMKKMACIGLMGFAGLVQAAGTGITAGQVTQSAVKWQQEPLSRQVLSDLATLHQTLASYCKSDERSPDLSKVRTAFGKASVSWGAMRAAVFGPMLEFDTLRLIDFQPTDPEMIHNAALTKPHGEADMILIGSAAKGFPALSWLLFQKNIKPGQAECNYAVEVTHDITDTINSLDWRVHDDGDASEVNAEQSRALQSYFRQLVGGVHDLAWDGLEKPELRIQQGSAPQWPSGDPAQADAYLQQTWKALRELLLMPDPAASQDTAHTVISLEAYLRSRGYSAVANDLHAQIVNVDVQFKRVQTKDTASVNNTADALKVLQNLMQGEVSKTLGFKLNFVALGDY